MVEASSAGKVSSSEQSAEEEVVLAEYIVHCKQEDSTPIETFSRHLKTINSRDQLVDVVLNGNSVEAFEKRITSEQAISLFNFLKLSRHIRHLDLSYNLIDDTAIPTLLDLIRVCSSIESLNLSGNSICESGGRCIAQVLSEGKNLSVLDLSLNAIGELAGQEIGMALFKSKKLQRLNLSSCEISIKSVNTIMQAMSDPEVDIQDLNIENAMVSWNKDGYVSEKIANMLAHNSSLKVLNLGKLAISDYGVKEIVGYGLIRNNAIASLNLRSNNIGVDGTRHLVRWLLSPDCLLEELDLSNNSIGNKGVKAISDCLKHNSSLKVLNLANNRLTSPGLLDLAEGLKHATSITQIYLWPSEFDHSASSVFLKLAQSRPEMGLDFIPYKNEEGECFAACKPE